MSRPSSSPLRFRNYLAYILGKDKDKDRVFLLKGFAGTGKTTLVGNFGQQFMENHLQIRFNGPNGKGGEGDVELLQYAGLHHSSKDLFLLENSGAVAITISSCRPTSIAIPFLSSTRPR